ncbi:alpha-L-fucosidase [Aurantiacibacter luteus]|uniref:alpha-L-fucosidase n=1 Tax=Aurantiacibacter luteus TaxID=1581420 RepID=A0A0G9MZE7_9SPHN|nr:alpha-L-fucosidase [Aurantiacibacter luteus]KLE35959.1 alpha-L-fucosidase [Aurantiacibacter luteus]
MKLTRRQFAAGLSTGMAAACAPLPPSRITSPRFAPKWDSLSANFTAPEWFRDAKFGIWAHWGPQCVPMAGDWYARRMYLQGDWKYDHHLANYGHPTQHGFIDLLDGWTAERWDPGALLDLYQRAGAKYFMALAVHHDNFDCFDSQHHGWNAMRIGPRRDIVGTWERLARERGMKFAISNHGSHAWHWFQAAYGYDPEGPLRGRRYDAWRLREADGRGKSWQGLDPQQFYTGAMMPMPPGIDTVADANAWHEANDRVWTEDAPPNNPAFVAKWKARAIDMIDRYRPDLFYYDNSEDLPFGAAGLEVTAHYYNRGLEWHDGEQRVAATAKLLPADKAGAVIVDVERGDRAEISPVPWQSGTCIGDWYYDEGIYRRHEYKSAQTIIHRLCDTVAKNGNLMLSVPIRPDGTLDDDEHAILEELAGWVRINGDAIFATRPAHVFGEGPTQVTAGAFGESNTSAFTARDIRYTRKGDDLFAIALGVPEDGRVLLQALGNVDVERVDLLGHAGPVPHGRTSAGVFLEIPGVRGDAPALAFRLRGAARRL